MTTMHELAHRASGRALEMTATTAIPPGDLRPIVVGVDGSPESELALDWGVDEARRRGLSLHLVHARELAGSMASAPHGAPTSWHDPAWVLRAARDRVSILSVDHPVDLVVTDEDVLVPAATALVAASAAADTVVVGTHRHGPVEAALLGSTSLRVAARAACPVVVVRRPASRDVAHPQIVLGVDAASRSGDALAYAFHRASDQGLPLTVICVWAADIDVEALRVTEAVADEVSAAAANARLADLREIVRPWREKFPDVRVHVIVAPGTPADVLVDESWAAELVVVGSHGLGGLRGLLLGSVTDSVLHRAHCPVAVVRSIAS